MATFNAPGPACVGRRRREQAWRRASSFRLTPPMCRAREPRAFAACLRTRSPSLPGKNGAGAASAHKLDAPRRLTWCEAGAKTCPQTQSSTD